MSLDGLRAWIGLVERKLAMRTRVFLVLVAIAVGGAGAAIYLAIEAKNDSLSKADLQQVRNELAVTPVPTEGGSTSQLEAEVSALQEEVAALRGEGVAPAGKDSQSSGPAGKGAGGGKSGAEESTGGVTPGSASGGATVPKNQKQLEELVEKAEDEAKAK
jgi:hypothetical protein